MQELMWLMRKVVNNTYLFHLVVEDSARGGEYWQLYFPTSSKANNNREREETRLEVPQHHCQNSF